MQSAGTPGCAAACLRLCLPRTGTRSLPHTLLPTHAHALPACLQLRHPGDRQAAQRRAAAAHRDCARAGARPAAAHTGRSHERAGCRWGGRLPLANALHRSGAAPGPGPRSAGPTLAAPNRLHTQPTHPLPTESEAAVQAALDRAMRTDGRTVVVIAHRCDSPGLAPGGSTVRAAAGRRLLCACLSLRREVLHSSTAAARPTARPPRLQSRLSTVRNADQTVVMDKGRVRADG